MAVDTNAVQKMLTAWEQYKGLLDQRDAEIARIGAETQETKNALEKANADIDKYRDEVKALTSRLIEQETKGMRPMSGAYYGAAPSGPLSEAKAATLKYWRKGEPGLSDMERKTLFVADSQAGGYLVPDEVRGPIIERLVQISPFRSLGTTQYTISTDNAKVPVEQGQYTANMVGEMDDVSAETSSSQIGMEDIPVHTGVALVVLSQQLAEDSAFNFESYVQRKVAQRFAKLQGQKFIGGNGRTAPEGVLTNSAVTYVASGDAALLTYDGINNLVHDLPTDYAMNAKIGMNRKTLGKLRGIKDGQQRPLWEPNVQTGDPGNIFGIPIVELPDMPDVAANAFPIIFGDFEQGYNWVDRLQLDMARLNDSKYLLKQQIALLFRARFGGQVVLAEALRKLKIAVS